MLLLDGLDEVSASKQQDVWKWLRRQTDAFPKIKVVISGRPNALPSQKKIARGFRLFDIADMSESAVREFIHKWHLAAKEELLDEADKKRVEAQESGLYGLLRTRQELKKLTKSPLLCAMICLLNRHRSKDFPGHPIDVYKHCSRVLLYARDLARDVDTSDYPPIGEEQRFALVEAIAYWMLDNNVLSISKEMAEDIVAKTLRLLLIDDKTVGPKEALRLLIDRGAVFQSVGENDLEFPHRSFLEYFAARALCDRHELGKLIRNSVFQEWHDVVVMSSSLLGSAMRTELINQLLNKEVSSEERPQVLLLAAACVEQATQLADSGLVERLTTELNEFFPPRTMQVARSLAMLGETIVERLSRDNTSKSIERRASIRALGIIGGERALDVLKLYAEKATRQDVSEVAKAIDRNGRRFRDVLAPLLAPRVTAGKQLEDLLLMSGGADFTRLVFSTPEDIPGGEIVRCDVIKVMNCSGHHDLRFCTLFRSSALVLDKCWQLKNLDVLAYAGNSISCLSLSQCRSLENCSALADMPLLTSIRITGCCSLVDIRPLRYLKRCSVELIGLSRAVYVPPEFEQRGWQIRFASG